MIDVIKELEQCEEDIKHPPDNDLVAINVLFKYRDALKSLKVLCNFALVMRCNFDYDIWGGCYEDEEYNERAVEYMKEIDPNIDWEKLVLV